jgi:putative ubiquitin-RnfH superfamily antitoxin RatB of RatAB toxin-antitoxin module
MKAAAMAADPGLFPPAAQADGWVRVEVVYAPAGGAVDVTGLTLPAGTTVGQALAASGVLARHDPAPSQADVGIWGRRVHPATVVREGDRVELYRRLLCDPKEARRLRHRRQRPRRSRSSAPSDGSGAG